MVDHNKPWLSIEAQIDKLASRGIDVGASNEASDLLRAIGYYRLTGYLYPFRRSEHYADREGKTRVRVLSEYLPGTSLHHAAQIIDFDRALRILVLDGIERIEVSLGGCPRGIPHQTRLPEVCRIRVCVERVAPVCGDEQANCSGHGRRDRAPSARMSTVETASTRKALDL